MSAADPKAAAAPEQNEILIDFERVPGAHPYKGTEIPDGYAGLNWDNAYILSDYNEEVMPGYGNVRFGAYSAYDASGLGAAFSASWDFDLKSGFFASAGGSRTVTIEGYDDGVLVAAKSLTLDTSRHFIRFDETFSGIDTVRIDAPGGQGSQVAFDNLLLAAAPQTGTAKTYMASLEPGGITWEAAKAAAEALGGHLATITSQAENDFVAGLVDRDSQFAMIDGRWVEPWLGGYQPEGSDEPAGGWTWITGEPFTYTNWAPGEPNNVGNQEDSLHLQYLVKNGELIQQWNDRPNLGFQFWFPVQGFFTEFDGATVRGSEGIDVIRVASGAVQVDARAGDDEVTGGPENDTLLGGMGDDTLDGGAGQDTADYSGTRLGVSVRLATGTATGDASEVGSDALVSIETVLGGSGADRIIGNSAANRLEGNAGDDFLEGGKNNDTLLGGSGDDTLAGALDHDWIEGGAGLDVLRGDSGNDTLAGGDNNDRLVGGAGNDRLEGGGGADELRGQSGADVLEGGGAGDRLYGGFGADTLTGGAGADRFFLTALGESGVTAATRDVITDFEAGVDVINLAKIDAVQGGGNDAFAFIGTAAFTAAGQVRFVQSGGNTLVEGNVDADLAPDFRIELTGLHTLAAGDFVL